MVYGYARVSTRGQDCYGNSLDGQEEALREAGATAVVREAYTGKTVERPKFEKLIEGLEEGDTLMVTKLDRFARSTAEGVSTIQALIERGIAVRVLNLGLLDNTATGKLLMTVMFAFAEFERDLIIQRTAEGKAVARANGTLKEGRPKKDLPKEADTYLELLKGGTMKVNEVAERLGVSRRTVYRLIAEN